MASASWRGVCYSGVEFTVEFCSAAGPVLALMLNVIHPVRAFIWTLVCFLAFGLYTIATLPVGYAMTMLESFTQKRLRYLDDFRGVLMLSTCVAILAVDFEVFPTRFAKSTDYGTSLMDVGPGGIVFAGGLVSALRQTSRGAKLQQARCLFAIGMLRLLATAATSYQVEVGEYGRHWNFFLTLSAIACLKALSPFPPRVEPLISAVVLLSYQAVLNSGLNVYLHSEDHSGNLIQQNKEGIYSLVGYWCLFTLGSCVSWILTRSASYCLRQAQLEEVRGERAWPEMWLCVWWLFVGLLVAVLFGAAHLREGFIEPVSRRSCNLAYVLWMMAYHTCQCLWTITTQICQGEARGTLPAAVNRNLFGVFLVANLLTGVVNLSFNTHAKPHATASLILGVYTFVLCLLAYLTDRRGLYYKL